MAYRTLPRLLSALGLLVAALTGCYVGVEPNDDATVGGALTTTSEGSGATLDASSSSTSSSTTSSSTSSSSSSGDETTSDTGVDPTTTDVTSTTGDPTTSTTDVSTTSGTTGDPTTGTTGSMGGYCEASDAWDPGWASLEDQVLTIVNQVRANGASCGAEGSFGPAGPLQMNALLRCAARYHSKDMVDRNFFSHTNPDGESPWDRIAKTGYGAYSTAGENIAAGSGTAAGVMDQWMSSDGHCANIMNPDFTEIGVGYYPGGQYGHVWTQVFAAK